jgi:hypothetical protein
MAFLPDNLRLELKSIYDSNLVQLASYKKDVNIHLVPSDSATHYSVITTSAHSNIDTHITLYSEDSEIEVASFSSNSINFGNDTLLRGNLVVFGSVLALGYDVLTHEEDKNNFILHNYGSSAEKGVNSATEKNIAYLNNLSSTTSNSIISYILTDLANMEETLGISQLTSFQNNMFTINDFENLFAVKTLDDFNQGLSNHFIVNDEYTPSSNTKQYNTIINGSLIASNLHTNIITADALYATQFYGDASQMYNVNREHFNTNELPETSQSSNQYFTYARAGIIAYSSNADISNYISSLYQSYNNLLDTQEQDTSNFIISFQSNLLANYATYSNNFSDYLAQRTGMTEHILYTSNKNLTTYFTTSSNALINLNATSSKNISNYILNSSNIITGNTRNSVTNVQDYADNTCNILFQNLQGFLASYKSSIVQTSNASETFRASSNINTSNSISSTQKQLLFFNSQSNIDANLITNRTSNTLKTYTTTQAAQTRDYLRSTSNNIINYANTSFRILNLHKQTTSNNVLHSLRYATTNLSNYIKSNSNHVAQTTNTTYKSMNDLIYNTSTYFNTAFQSIRDYSNLSMYNTSNTIQNVSNIILNQAATFMHQQTTDNRAFLDTMEIKFDKLMHALTTDDVPMLPQAQAKNVYYTRDLFNSSVSQQTLDNLQNAYTHSGSNSIIKNNMHNNDLTVAGKVTAHNLVVYNDAAFKISVYDTERVEIQNWSNSASAAVTFYNHSSAPANIINVMNDKNENIFLLQNNGSIGIKTANPAYTLDASAVIAGDYFHGSGKFLTNVNLVDKTTADLPEADEDEASALYFRSSRVSEILATSNLETSNFIATQIQTMHIPVHSNLILTTSNLLADMTSYANIQFSNYTIHASNEVFTYIINAPADQWQHAIRTSNVLKEYIQAFDAGQSNYITNTTSDSGAAIKRSQTTVAYYLDLTSNNIQNFQNNQLTSHHNHISNHSNILSTRMNAIISDHSNLVSGLSNLVASLYLSNYVGATSAALTSHINSVSTYHSNFMDITSNNLVSITKINAATLLAIYNAGDLYHYSHTYDPNILHINFKDKKILNGINSDHFRIFSASESSNFIDIYPVMDNFTSISYVPNYSSLNAYAFNASPQLHVYVSNEYEIKKLMNALNSSQPIGIHFAFNSQNIDNASIYSLGNTDSLNLGITITTSQVCVSIGNTEFFASTTAIMANTWYIVDIILNKTDTANIFVGIYINSEVQQIYPTNTGVYANNFMYQQGDNVLMYIGKSDVKIQDFRIYSKSTIDDVIYDIHNVLFKGLNNPEYTITSNVIVDALRWVQSSNYTSNYFSPLGRYITYSGDVAIGKKDAPQATLDVYTDDPGMYSIKTNNPIWVQSATLASSDLRIKTNIRDFQPHEALNQILAIQPKTYQYIHNDKKVFGFSAQQIRSVIPNAVSLHTNSIPSINTVGVLYDINYIKLQNNVKHNLTIPSTVALYYQDEVYYEEIEAIIDDTTFKIANKSAIPNAAIFVYGTIIQDFHTLDKNYIYTLNVCATQDLYRMHEALASNLDAFIFISSYEKPLIYDSQTQALYNDVSDTKDHMTSSALVIQDADKVTRRAKGMLEQIDYNLNSLNLTQALSLSTIVSTLMNDIYACENQNKPVIEENLNVFAKFNDRIQGLNTMQTDIDSINTILQKHNMK